MALADNFSCHCQFIFLTYELYIKNSEVKLTQQSQ